MNQSQGRHVDACFELLRLVGCVPLFFSERPAFPSVLIPMQIWQRIGDFYEVGDEIGRGCFAVVYRGKDIRTGEEVAIKVLRKDKHSWKHFYIREMDILKYVDHKNVVRTLDIFDTKKTLYIVMEMMKGGKLTTWGSVSALRGSRRGWIPKLNGT